MQPGFIELIFLDFDGVMNTVNSDIMKRHARNRGLGKRLRKRLANFMAGLRWRRPKDGVYSFKNMRRDPLGILGFIGHLAMDHVSDHAEFCPAACANVQYILDKSPNAMIVVSSVWRSSGVRRMRQILARNGIDPKRVIACTPDRGEMPNGTRVMDPERGHQIQAWMNWWEGPPIRSYVIIDDDSDMAHLMARLVKTDGYHGLMYRDAVKAIEKLKEAL